MNIHEFDSAQLFTPGRASYIEEASDGTFELKLTEASEHRAMRAAVVFDPALHTTALFAGGYPGIAENWPPEHTPPLGKREADLMSVKLHDRLLSEGYTPYEIDKRIKRQGESNNSIGDVAASIEQGYLDPNDFHRETVVHGIHLVTGGLHGLRFRHILAKGLDIDPKRIFREPMYDVYRRPATEFRAKERASIAIAKEYAAIALTRLVLKDVKPGDVKGLREAEERFNTLATRQK